MSSQNVQDLRDGPAMPFSTHMRVNGAHSASLPQFFLSRLPAYRRDGLPAPGAGRASGEIAMLRGPPRHYRPLFPSRLSRHARGEGLAISPGKRSGGQDCVSRGPRLGGIPNRLTASVSSIIVDYRFLSFHGPETSSNKKRLDAVRRPQYKLAVIQSGKLVRLRRRSLRRGQPQRRWDWAAHREDGLLRPFRWSCESGGGGPGMPVLLGEIGF